MTDHETVMLGAAEGTGAEIAWVVVYILCWFFVVFPFVLWYAGVRRPRAERDERRRGAVEETDAGAGAVSEEAARIAG